MAVSGRFGSNNAEPGVIGHNDTFQGVSGTSNSDTGVFGGSSSARGVHGDSGSGSGVFATSKTGQGVTTFSEDSIGIFSQGGVWAGVFSGAIVVGKGPGPKAPGVQPNQVNGCVVINDGGNLFLNGGGSLFLSGGGDVILGNGDCAEDFTVAGAATPEPGTVMVLGEACEDKLCESYAAYDRRVVGVISGAGSYKPGLVLDRQPDQTGRVPIALLGKVYCKVDAQYGQIQVGDLLCTSPTRGHAMKASDPQKSFGAIIGKALRPLAMGCALVPILVALQ